MSSARPADGRIGVELGEALKAEARRRVSNGSFIGYQTYAAQAARELGQANPAPPCRRWVMSDKTQAEHNESAHPPIADMTADIDFCR